MVKTSGKNLFIVFPLELGQWQKGWADRLVWLVFLQGAKLSEADGCKLSTLVMALWL